MCEVPLATNPLKQYPAAFVYLWDRVSCFWHCAFSRPVASADRVPYCVLLSCWISPFHAPGRYHFSSSPTMQTSRCPDETLTSTLLVLLPVRSRFWRAWPWIEPLLLC